MPVMLPIIRYLANVHIISLPPDRKPPNAAEAREEFAKSFFSGFTNYGGLLAGGTDAQQQGFLDGQVYRRENPDKVRFIFESYGYVAAEAVGVWKVGFEYCSIVPDGRRDEIWWLSFLHDTESDVPRNKQVPSYGYRVHIIGFVSKKGRHGHMGSYDREFFATKFVMVSGG